MRKFIVERELPRIGRANRDELRAAASWSNEALHRLGPSAQWIQSYVADGKTFCVYLAEDEEATRRHAELSGIPASRITQAGRIIGPTTAARA